MRTVRQFMGFCFKNGYHTEDLSSYAPNVHYEKRSRIPSSYSRDNVMKLLATVDRSNPVGKRNYAILLLIARLGLRFGDAVNLRFENISWNENRISLTQHKTGRPLTLPLPLSQPALTRELVSDWIAFREGEAKKNRMHRITCVNQFGKYLKRQGYEVYASQPQKHWNADSFTPYIFTHAEIEKIFRASDSVKPVAQSRDIHKALPVLIRMLYSCGLRVSEAVGLRCGDVDLEKGILTVREAKFGKDRLIPILSSLLGYCREYQKSVIPWAGSNDYFFMAPDRTMLSPNTVYGRFRRILSGKADFLTAGKETGRGCMICDIRLGSYAAKMGGKRRRPDRHAAGPVGFYGAQILRRNVPLSAADCRGLSAGSKAGRRNLCSRDSRR